MTDFLTLIDRLTKPTPGTIDRDDGPELRTQDGLLEALRQSVPFGIGSSAGSSQFGSKLPLDSMALDILDEIDRQAAEALASVDPRPTPYGTTESYIRLWAAQTSEQKLTTVTVKATVDHPTSGTPTVFSEKLELTAIRLVERWVQRIEDYFNPPSTREIKAPCPACDVEFVHRKVDGVNVTSRALNFVRDTDKRTTGARCSSCGVSWAPSQFEWLARHIGATPLPELEVTE